jgi:pimeloyl-ACP methyl ester carboxylesterase
VGRFRSQALELHYEDTGDGAPVVLLHGFTSSFAGTWKRSGWVDALTASGRRAVGLDFPGHGESEAVPDPARVSLASLAQDVVALLDHLRLGEVDLVGLSMGAGVALRLAMVQPARVRRLVVAGIGDAAVNDLHDAEQVARIAAAFASGPGATADPVAARIHRNAEHAGNDPRGLLPYLQGDGWPGGLDELLPVRAPVLLFVAENDQYMVTSDAIRRWLAHAEVVSVPGDHHALALDEELLARAIHFLNAG